MFICKRVLNKRTNLGKIYLVNIYTSKTIKKKLNTIWLTKKNGISWGIFLFYFIYSFIYLNPIKSAKLIKKFTLNTIYREIYYG